MGSLKSYLRSSREVHVEQLKELLRIPSISTESTHAGDVRRAAEWTRDRLEAAGCTATVYKTARHPIVYAEWLGAPGAPTLLVYGHYDVQPVDPLELWTTPPFEPTIRDKRIYARGASDDKGQFIIHVNALEAHLRERGTCPVNVKFLIEGEEEIGSPNLEPFIKQNRKLLACNAVAVSDTAMFAKGVPSICYGLRGLCYLEIRATGTRRDLHSGVFGGTVVNPANALTQMLGTLKDAKGRVTVPGFYENVKRLTVLERRALASLPFSERKYKQAIGAPELYGEAGYTTLERAWCRPTLDINGIWGGFTGEGAKTVIPGEVSAKLSMRLVPNQGSREIGGKVMAHLKKIAPPSIKLSVRSLHGGEAWVTSTDHPVLQAAARALKRSYGRDPVFVREGGSIPVVATFGQVLKVRTVLLGIGLQDDNLHAPNEKLDLDNFYRGIETSTYLMEELGGANSGIGNSPRRKRTSTKR